MHSLFSVHQGRLRPSFIWVIVLFAVLLAACSAPGEPEATAPVARETAANETVVAPTTEPTIEATEEPTAEPTEAAAPEPTALPSTEPADETASIPSKGTLQMDGEVSFEVLAQYGGVASAVAAADGIAYVGFGPRLMVLDVSDPANPVLLGESGLLFDNIADIAVADGFAYLAAGRAGLVVVDVSNTADPVIVSDGPNYAGPNPPNAETVQVDGAMAFVTDYYRQDSVVGLLHFDISSRSNPVLLNGYEIQINDSFVVENGRIVIVGNGRIEVRDAAMPGTTQGQATLAGGDYSSKVFVQGDRAYVVETGVTAGVEVFDISNIEAPELVGEIAPVELFIGTQVAANETTLFSVGTFGEFGFCESQIDFVDISGDEPESITRLSPGVCVTDIFVDGDLLYVSGRGGLKIFDVSNLAAAQEMSLFVNPDGFHAGEAVAVNGDATYVLTGEGSGAELRTLNLMGETAELYSDAIPLGMVVVDMFVNNDTLVLPQWQGSLYTFALSDPTAPELSFDPEENMPFSIGDIVSYSVDGNYVYLPITDGVLIGGVGVVDLSDPANPDLVTTFETGDYMVMHMTNANGYLYVLVQGEAFNIFIYDVSDPLAPEAVGKVLMPESANRLAVWGDTLYAACDNWNCQSLYAIDISEPETAEIVGRWQMNVGVLDVVPAGDGLFYLTTNEGRIWLLNVSDPDNPFLAGFIQLPGEYLRLKVEDGVLYAAAYGGGLYLLSVE